MRAIRQSFPRRVRVAPAAMVSLAFAAAGSSGCMAPIVRPATGTQPPAVQSLEDGAVAASARRIETTTADGVVLRGIHVQPDEPGPGPRPVLLHLLPASVTVTDGLGTGLGRIGLGPTLARLAAAGFDSVVFDYRGTGGSDGTRDPARLSSDGRAIYAAAVGIAGGDERRVAIRAASLGTLVAADLIDRGARPGGVLLVAPIQASSVVPAAAEDAVGPVLAPLVAVGLRHPSIADLEHVLPYAPWPTTLIVPEDDRYLPAAGRRRVVDAARASGFRVVLRPGDHYMATLRLWGFTIDPDGLGGRRTPELSPDEREYLRRLEAVLGPPAAGRP